MSRRHISQREARAALKRVEELERQRKQERNVWLTQYPNGIHIGEWEPADWFYHTIKTARRLGFPVVVTLHDTDGKINFHIVKS